jgi:uncharacterized alkaline shock family protein YloU
MGESGRIDGRIEGSLPQGEVKIAARVVTRIAEAVVRQVDGVHPARSAPQMLGGLARMFSQSHSAGWIQTTINQGRAVSVDIRVAADLDIDIVEAARELQALVAEKINGMTGFTVRRIRVNVIDLVLPPNIEEPTPELAEAEEQAAARGRRP